jgi:hypothetical protein
MLTLNLLQTTKTFDSMMNQIDVTFCQKFAIDLLGIVVLILGIHKYKHKNSENAITFMMFNVIIFLISNVLHNTEMSMGAAFGLFAVFSMLRYRTEDISMIEMTYLFLSISVGIVSAIGKSHWTNTLFYVASILFILFILEFAIFRKRHKYMNIQYENIQHIHTNEHHVLISNLKKKLGVNVVSFKVIQVDLVNEIATLRVMFHEN